jgi:hypothetical protein
MRSPFCLQEALAGSEERIRAAEQVERARLEVEYQSKLAATQQEVVSGGTTFLLVDL